MATRHPRPLRALFAAGLALASAGAMAGEMTLFQNRDFRGSATTLQSPMLDMSVTPSAARYPCSRAEKRNDLRVRAHHANSAIAASPKR